MIYSTSSHVMILGTKDDFPISGKLKLLINTNEIYYYDKIAQTVDFQLLSL